MNDEQLIRLLSDPDRQTLTTEEAGRELVETGPSAGHNPGTKPASRPHHIARG